MKKLFFFGMFSTCLLSGCSHYYYVPNIQNVPLFREKNEFRISGSYGSGDESNSFELQGGWSAGSHLGLTTSYLYASSPNASSDNDWGKGSYIDLAAGYFTPLSQYGVFEIYGGFGGSSQTHNYVSSEYDNYIGQYTTVRGKAYLKSRRLFIQPAIGFEYKIIDFAVSVRMCRLSFNDVDINFSRSSDEFNYDRLTELQAEKEYYFVEPAATLRAGWDNVKIQAQVSIGSYQYNGNIPFEPFHLGLGVNIAFGEGRKSKTGIK